MKIKVLLPSTYLNNQNRAQECQPGDTLEVIEWYGEEMVRLGQGEAVTDEAAAKPKRKKAATPQKRKPGGMPQNPFLT